MSTTRSRITFAIGTRRGPTWPRERPRHPRSDWRSNRGLDIQISANGYLKEPEIDPPQTTETGFFRKNTPGDGREPSSRNHQLFSATIPHRHRVGSKSRRFERADDPTRHRMGRASPAFPSSSMKFSTEGRRVS